MRFRAIWALNRTICVRKLCRDLSDMDWDAESGPMRLSIQLGLPDGTLVCPGIGERRHIEYWLLIYPEEQRQDDWNYWIVIECLQPSCKWEVTRIVPWWSRYGWWWDTEPGARRGGVSDGNVLNLGEPLPDVSDPPPDNPPYPPASSSWEGRP